MQRREALLRREIQLEEQSHALARRSEWLDERDAYLGEEDGDLLAARALAVRDLIGYDVLLESY